MSLVVVDFGVWLSVISCNIYMPLGEFEIWLWKIYSGSNVSGYD